ncbi:hypothetical protein HQ576_03195, partial [bacterium]|nr:hypothetical protein [bacterium]
KTSTPLHKAQAISRHLFLTERFAYKRDNRRLDETLDSRRGNCFSLSILYLCAARNTGLPIRLVAVPGHAYLRCDDGKTPFNIEPSMGGIIFTGERHAFRRRRPLGGIHLKLLSRAQTVGLLHSDLGAALGRAGRYDAACTHFARAIEIAPEIAEAYCDWGVALAHQKQWAPACDKFSRAILAHRHYAEAYYGWGAALARMGQHAWACDKFARAVEVNPGYADAWFNWGSMLLATGQTRDGVDKLERAARLNPSLRPAVERLRSAIPREPPR